MRGTFSYRKCKNFSLKICNIYYSAYLNQTELVTFSYIYRTRKNERYSLGQFKCSIALNLNKI